jgi:hypothetical protein
MFLLGNWFGSPGFRSLFDGSIGGTWFPGLFGDDVKGKRRGRLVPAV